MLLPIAYGVYARPWLRFTVPAAAADQPARLEGEIFTLLPGRIEPQTITRSAGPFYLAVHNRKGSFEPTSLHIDDERGAPVMRTDLPSGQLDWGEVVDLSPGTYTLTDATGRTVCSLVIKP